MRSAVVVATAVLLAACSASADDRTSGELRVIASFLPLEEVVRRVAGADAEVTNLVRPGSSAHDLQLTPGQLEAMTQADLVVYLGSGFQPAVEDAISGLPDRVVVVDLLEGLELLDVTPTLEGVDGETDGEVLAGGKDPHVWLDPVNMIRLTDAVESALTELAPDRDSDFARAADGYRDELASLDSDMSTGLADCVSDVIVTSHRAFEYLSRRYGLRQIPIAGVSPSEEPSAKTLEAIAAEARSEGVRVIYFEENLPADLSETVAAEIGASVDVLDPVEGFTQEQLDDGATYLTAMRENLAALRAGLECP